ncbi:hypothetical protein ACLIBH_12320 [Virgibacillus sp. W0430]|uniref:hypothetical protein n=1 Tax=Virgibacillus sp. W0430 TaxID=3391580 RepID=UPI003F450867
MHITENQLKLITETASQEAIRAYREHSKKQQKEKYDRRLRNIKLLLRNYRSFKKHCQDIKLEIDEINERLEFVTIDSNEFKLESIKRSKEKTLIMVKYIEKMMNVYKVLCDQSEDPEEIRRHNVVYDLYVSNVKKTVEEVAKCQNVVPRTVYRDIDKACESLVVLMFGVDGVKFK